MGRIKPYSILVPTHKRHQNLKDQIRWLKRMKPEPEEVLVVHARNKFTEKFDFGWLEGHSDVRLKMYEDDPGLLECKYTTAFEELDTEFVFVCDDDVFPGKKYPKNFFTSYHMKPGVYGGIGFKFAADHFEGTVVGGSYQFPGYEKRESIVEVDAPGQSFFFKKSDVGYLDESYFPDWVCEFCADDIKLAWKAWLKGTKCFVAPHEKAKTDSCAVYDLREGDLDTQSLVRGDHNDAEHKDKFIFQHMIPEGYERVWEQS